MNTTFAGLDDSEVINDIPQLLQILDERYETAYLRGQENHSWGVLPTIARSSSYCGKNLPTFTLAQERDLLHRFRRHAYPQNMRVLSEWEALFLARHHGLPVRLVDWTTNPLVALYWACRCTQNASEQDGAIWVFRRREENKSNHVDVFSEADPLRLPGIRLIVPFYPTQRMVVQSGVFTIHEHPWIDLRKLQASDYDVERNDIESGEVLKVPLANKARLMMQLERLAINERTLFPDLDGIARGLKESEILKANASNPISGSEIT